MHLLLYMYIPHMYMYNKQCTVIVNRLLLNFLDGLAYMKIKHVKTYANK